MTVREGVTFDLAARRARRPTTSADVIACHAAEVDRAFAEKARAALDVVAQDAMVRPERPVSAGSVEPKMRDRRHAEKRREVHRARCRSSAADRSARSSSISCASVVLPTRSCRHGPAAADDRVGDRAVVLHAEDLPLGTGALVHGAHHFREALRQPALRRAVLRAGAKPDDRARRLRGAAFDGRAASGAP